METVLIQAVFQAYRVGTGLRAVEILVQLDNLDIGGAHHRVAQIVGSEACVGTKTPSGITITVNHGAFPSAASRTLSNNPGCSCL